MSVASRKLDKAVSKGVIHKNQAANRKSGAGFEARLVSEVAPARSPKAPDPFEASAPSACRRLRCLLSGPRADPAGVSRRPGQDWLRRALPICSTAFSTA